MSSKHNSLPIVTIPPFVMNSFVVVPAGWLRWPEFVLIILSRTLDANRWSGGRKAINLLACACWCSFKQEKQWTGKTLKTHLPRLNCPVLMVNLSVFGTKNSTHKYRFNWNFIERVCTGSSCPTSSLLPIPKGKRAFSRLRRRPAWAAQIRLYHRMHMVCRSVNHWMK